MSESPTCFFVLFRACVCVKRSGVGRMMFLFYRPTQKRHLFYLHRSCMGVIVVEVREVDDGVC